MKKYIIKSILVFVLSLFYSNIFAQVEIDTISSSNNVIVKMNNGDEYRGVIINRTNEKITLKTVNGEIGLISSNVRHIGEDNYNGKFAFKNPHATRYFFGPSGIPLEKKKGYYQNILVSTNFINYGISKNISIGGGFEFISTLNGLPIWFFTPKVGFNLSDKVALGGGVIMAGLAEEGTASLIYSSLTYGNSESNLSVGLGYGLIAGEVSNYPAIMISGTHRLSNSIALLSENYILPNISENSVYFGIQGIRILGKNNSFDLGAIIIPQAFEFIKALPYIGYVRVF